MNACELEIDLFCKGLRVAADVSLEGARGMSRTRAGLGSGLELALPTGSRLKNEIWVNAPIVESFAARSPYVLHGSARAGYAIVDTRDGSQYSVRIPREPVWYSTLTSRDIPMGRIGVLQGTSLGISVSLACTFWNCTPPLNCWFCTAGQNGAAEAADKTLPDVIETCWAAREESGVTFVQLSGGFQASRGIAFTAPYVKAIKEDVGLLVGVQLAPERDFSQYDRLIDLGVDHLSFGIEFFDPEWFQRICPGKARMIGQRLFLDALKYCAARMPRGSVSGDIIAGIEPIERTFEAIDYIAALGAVPTVYIFRPTVGSDMESWSPPSFQEMTRVMRHLYDACRRNWLLIGVAPNVEVSLVVNPDDVALLADRNAGFYAYEAWRRLVKVAARPVFRYRMRPASRRVTSGCPSTTLGAP